MLGWNWVETGLRKPQLAGATRSLLETTDCGGCRYAGYEWRRDFPPPPPQEIAFGNGCAAGKDQRRQTRASGRTARQSRKSPSAAMPGAAGRKACARLQSFPGQDPLSSITPTYHFRPCCSVKQEFKWLGGAYPRHPMPAVRLSARSTDAMRRYQSTARTSHHWRRYIAAGYRAQRGHLGLDIRNAPGPDRIIRPSSGSRPGFTAALDQGHSSRKGCHVRPTWGCPPEYGHGWMQCYLGRVASLMRGGKDKTPSSRQGRYSSDVVAALSR